MSMGLKLFYKFQRFPVVPNTHDKTTKKQEEKCHNRNSEKPQKQVVQCVNKKKINIIRE